MEGLVLELIYKHEDLIELFQDISPFNMKRDIKYLNKNHISLDKVLQEIEATLLSKNYDAVYESVSCVGKGNFVLIKVRIKNPQNNKGESSGFRVIGVVNECEDHAFIFNLYPKDGANRKDDMTAEEEKKAKDLFKEISE
jgi:hypothetical protein